MTPDTRGQEVGNQAPPQRTVGQPFNPYKLFPGILIPEPICKYKGLSLGAKMIYGRLCRYAGENGVAYPGISTLGAEIGIGETQARGYVKELEQERFIDVDRENRHFRKDGSGGSNGYVFLWHPAFLGEQGASRKASPPPRKTEGVPPRKTEPLTPAENRTRRESVVLRESGKESQSTTDYQRTNRTNRDSHAGDGVVTDAAEEELRPKPSILERRVPRTAEERNWLSDAIGSYGRRRVMRDLMGEEPPPGIIQKCLVAADGLSVKDIFEILRHRCLHGFEPGTSKGPRGWGWFPTVIENAVKAWREQEAAAQDPSRKQHLSEFPVNADPQMLRAISAFDTLDDLGATA